MSVLSNQINKDMIGANIDMQRIADSIYDSDFILDKAAVTISGVTKEQFIKNYEMKLNINQPILVNPVYGDRLYPPK